MLGQHVKDQFMVCLRPSLRYTADHKTINAFPSFDTQRFTTLVYTCAICRSSPKNEHVQTVGFKRLVLLMCAVHNFGFLSSGRIQ